MVSGRSKWLRCLSSNLCVAQHHQTLVHTVWCAPLWCTQFGVWWSWRGGGLQAFSGSPQIHSKCLPHSQPRCQPHSQHQLLTISTHVSLKSSDPDFFEQPAHMIKCPPCTASPPPFIYTLCSASTCTPICQQAGALLIASVARLFQHRLELILSCNFCLHTCLF